MSFYTFMTHTATIFLDFCSRLMDFQQAQFFFVFCIIVNIIIQTSIFGNHIRQLQKHNTLLAESIEYLIYTTESRLNILLKVTTEKVENLNSFENTKSLDYLKKRNKILEEKIIELKAYKKRPKH